MTTSRRVFLLLSLVCLAGVFSPAQRFVDRGSVPNWEIDKEFSKDVFTFIRVQYTSASRYDDDSDGWRGGGRWMTDYPDAELNLCFRLQQMTSLKVNPEGKVLRLTDKELFHYPFIYIVEPGRLRFSEEEVTTLRRYLWNGGFLMVDDFWGEAEWLNFYREIKRVFPKPEQEPRELSLDHPIFNCVFPIKEKHQIPNIQVGTWSQQTGVTWERWDAKEVHYKGIFDDNGRMMSIICHNTDLGDGWEREGENEYYFREFSERRAYPLGINIIFYAMTH
jgi:hypothetical protein